MRGRVLTCLALVALSLLAADASAQRRTGAQIQNFIPNARAFGMGGAFTAVARDEWAVWWNPAALGSARKAALSFAPFTEMLPDGNDGASLLSAAAAGARNGFGVGGYLGYLDYFLPSMDIDFPRYDEEANPHETAMFLAGGVDLARVLSRGDLPVSVSVGASVKRLAVHLAPDWASPDGEAGIGSAYDGDIAVSVVGHLPHRSDERTGNRLTASYAYVRRNVFDHRIEYVDQFGEGVALGSLGRVGVAALAELGSDARGGNRAELSVAFDREGSPRGLHQGSIHHFGVEVGGFSTVYARYGVITHPYEGTRRETWGLGLSGDRLLPTRLRAMRLRLDYARGPQVTEAEDVDQLTLSTSTAR